ncbi:G-type lectin S-receptor-like serine/threonine-protein kinase At4g27290 [Pistacia vera]|uniref:G-type lectin S-receptor-like serine/threonine-protein kinase At4g27290 n=1 Tax=Pistacia vera TaxID=55513 RepID=UPI0012637E2D|nr:G-type lectin S-receptor-like serine/threonine-protein kinase At4g27290 [Pistacia vera]
MKSFLFFHIFSSFIVLSGIKLSLAADTISPAQFIHDGEKLISSAKRFELGFFSPGSSKNRYLGIWYRKSPEMVVWVANRNRPIIDPHGALTISNNGNLVLLDQRKGIVWSSSIYRKVKNPVAELLDSGNFILRDNLSTSSDSYLWQSFDHPSDTLLPGMKLGWDLNAGLELYLTSWRSGDDPSSGDFTFRLDIHVLPQTAIYRGSIKLARTGPWNGVYFGGTSANPNLLFVPILVHNQDKIYYRYECFNNPIIMLLKINQSGMMQRLIWKERSAGWDIVYSAPEDLCENYGRCGANGVCSIDKTPICECLKGFISKSEQNQSSAITCVPSSSLDCTSGDRFTKLADIKLPDLLEVSLNESMNLQECENKCLKNCSCRAYANFNVTRGSGCLMWFGDLIDIRKLLETKGRQDVYIRVKASEVGMFIFIVLLF